MEAPQNKIWGPALWLLLHSSAERIGTKVLSRLPQEEKRIWLALLGSLRYSLPCPVCKKHYTKYLFDHPIPLFSKESIRLWLFSLHSHVNQQPNPMTLEQLPDHYGKEFLFHECHRIVEQQMTCALRLGWCRREDMMKTLRFLEEMRRFYDFT
jgi:hypothetical protein